MTNELIQPGLEERAYSGRLHIAPRSEIRAHVERSQVVLDGAHSQPFTGEGETAEIEAFFWSARSDNPTALTILEPVEYSGQPFTGEVNTPHLVLAVPEVNGEYYLSLRVRDAQGRSDTSSTYFVIEEGQLILDDWSWQNTDWVEQAVVYGVIPRNFGPNGYLSIIERLDDLQDLGVNALWLSPINLSPPNNFGYHVLNYLELSDLYGSKDDFRQMVQEAHLRGIHVLMDFVPNHTSEQHRYFQDALANGQASPYWHFYDRDESGLHTHYFHWNYLPNLNFNNPDVERWITEAFAYWVREFDVDGFRVDVAWGIRQRNPDYWPRWRSALKRIKPDLLLLAEAGARDDYYFTQGFDAAYDWNDELGHWAWEHVFDDPALLTERLHQALTHEGKGFHDDALIFRFLNNNDTGERFLTRYGLDLTRVATALLLTLPGIPCIYTGDEIGAEFMPYKNPEPISWDNDPHDLRPYHQKLIALRKSVKALHSRYWRIVPVEPQQQLYAYLRRADGDQPALLVIHNFGDTPIDAVIDLPEGFESFRLAPQWFDLLSEQTIQILERDPLSIPVQASSSLILSIDTPPGD